MHSYFIYRISARLGRPRRYAALDDTPQILLHKFEFSPPKKGLDLVFKTGHNLAEIRYIQCIYLHSIADVNGLVGTHCKYNKKNPMFFKDSSHL